MLYPILLIFIVFYSGDAWAFSKAPLRFAGVSFMRWGLLNGFLIRSFLFCDYVSLVDLCKEG